MRLGEGVNRGLKVINKKLSKIEIRFCLIGDRAGLKGTSK